MASTRTKLTKRVIDALKPLPGADVTVMDSELTGYGVRMKPSGVASFFIRYRTPHGAERRLAFAKVGTLAPDEARAKARRLLAEAENGADPSAERHQKRTALTVAELCEQYLEAARAGNVTTRFRRTKRASTVAIDEGRVSRHIAPLLGSKVASDLTRADVQRMCDAIAAGKTAAKIKTKARGVARVTGGAGTATRVAGLLGGIFTWGEKRGLVTGQNPVRGLDLRADEAKDRVLSTGELAALGKSIEAAPSMAGDALRLIALTALRRGEAYALRWREIDFEGSCLRLESTKTGRSTRPVGKAAIDLLKSLPQLHDEWVFPNRFGTAAADPKEKVAGPTDPKKKVVAPADLKKKVAAIFDAAGLSDARGHDLRRTFASIAAECGYSDATIGELIGHAKRGVTAKHYIRRPDAALVEAATRVSERIAAAMAGDKKGEVMSFKRSDSNSAV